MSDIWKWLGVDVASMVVSYFDLADVCRNQRVSKSWNSFMREEGTITIALDHTATHDQSDCAYKGNLEERKHHFIAHYTGCLASIINFASVPDGFKLGNGKRILNPVLKGRYFAYPAGQKTVRLIDLLTGCDYIFVVPNVKGIVLTEKMLVLVTGRRLLVFNLGMQFTSRNQSAGEPTPTKKIDLPDHASHLEIMAVTGSGTLVAVLVLVVSEDKTALDDWYPLELFVLDTQAKPIVFERRIIEKSNCTGHWALFFVKTVCYAMSFMDNYAHGSQVRCSRTDWNLLRIYRPGSTVEICYGDIDCCDQLDDWPPASRLYVEPTGHPDEWNVRIWGTMVGNAQQLLIHISESKAVLRRSKSRHAATWKNTAYHKFSNCIESRPTAMHYHISAGCIGMYEELEAKVFGTMGDVCGEVDGLDPTDRSSILLVNESFLVDYNEVCYDGANVVAYSFDKRNHALVYTEESHMAGEADEKKGGSVPSLVNHSRINATKGNHRGQRDIEVGWEKHGTWDYERIFRTD